MDTDLAPRRAGTHAPEGLSGSAALVSALQDPACYPHPAAGIELIETHISWVLLAGDYAYKLKKPVRLPFLDFSTLESRLHYCEEELRLNRRTAPGIYLEVVPIVAGALGPRIGGTGTAIEFAVKMRRFPAGALFSDLARAGRLGGTHVDALAEAVARLHEQAGPAPPRPRGNPAARPVEAAMANFGEMDGMPLPAEVRGRLAPLRLWTRREARALAGRFASRAANGFERECHGDLHLANVALVDGAPVPFDAIEFSQGLRFTDVACDVAFAAMDLARHALPRLAARFVDRYLAITGDYEALTVLRFYEVYRALVRAKVAAIALGQATPGSTRARAASADLEDFVALARRLSRRPSPLLVVMHGLSASGKTTVAGLLAEALGGVRVRSDVERKRLHGLGAQERAGAAPGAGIYGAAGHRGTYDRLEEVARLAISGGYPVVVDAAFLERADRDRFRKLALASGAAFRIVSCIAPEAVLRERISARARGGRDASDADLAVLEEQQRTAEPPAAAEHALVVDTAQDDHESTVEAFATRLAAAT